MSLLPFDWEIGGWGVPTVDFIQFTRQSVSPDLDVYWSVAREAWPQCSIRDIRRLAEFGKIFRALQVISWNSWSVAYEYRYEHELEWLRDCIKTMQFYDARITRTLPLVGWEA